MIYASIKYCKHILNNFYDNLRMLQNTMKIFYSTVINLNIFEPSYPITSGCIPGDLRRVPAAVNRRFAGRIKSPFTKDRVRKQL